MRIDSAVQMGRKRTKDFDLPPRMQRRGERLYYVGANKRWVPLGTDLAYAKRRWADFEAVGEDATVGALCDRYVGDCMAKASDSTKRQYKSCANIIRAKWGDLPPDYLSPPQLAVWRDTCGKPGTANTVLSLLRVAYRKGIEWGWATTNPAAAVAFVDMPIRERVLTDEEFKAIWSAAPRWLKLAMDIAYLTTLRPCDIRALRWDAVGTAMQSRTKKTKVRQAFAVSDALAEILEEARQRPVLGLYVVGSDKGRKISPRMMQEHWRAICDAAGIPDAQFRDIRPRGAIDAEREGYDFQAMLGHTTRAMSERYLKAHRVIAVQPLRKLIR